MSANEFFNESTEQSQVKAIIVAKYFWAWAKVITPVVKTRGGKIAYVDLFAGPGRYKDGTMSTPLLVLEKAIQDNDMRRMLVTVFNDKDRDNVQALQEAISGLHGIQSLQHRPRIRNQEVGEQIAELFKELQNVPTLLFVDPWGYKGLSLELLNRELSGWGCDCVFFFNYNRINMGVANPLVKEHMDALFGEQRADHLRHRLSALNPEERESEIVESLCLALKDTGRRYPLPFCFKNDRGTRTSHHLIFVTKHFKGYEIMKQIMAAESSKSEQGVASLAYCPADRRQPTLFELSRPLDDLEGLLSTNFAGQTLLMHQVYESHNFGTPYIKRNYKEALLKLEMAGKVTVTPPRSERRAGTFGDNVLISFPTEGQ